MWMSGACYHVNAINAIQPDARPRECGVSQRSKLGQQKYLALDIRFETIWVWVRVSTLSQGLRSLQMIYLSLSQGLRSLQMISLMLGREVEMHSELLLSRMPRLGIQLQQTLEPNGPSRTVQCMCCVITPPYTFTNVYNTPMYAVYTW